MAGIELSAKPIHKHSPTKKAGRKRRRRLGVHIDTTPLVDLAFLLLTFFLLTTKLIQPQMMHMSIPPISEDVRVVEDNLYTVYIADNGVVYYTNGKTQFQKINVQDIGQKTLDLISLKHDALITAVKAAPGSPYDTFIQVVDELNAAEYSLTQYDPDYAATRKRKFTLASLTQQEQQQLKGL